MGAQKGYVVAVLVSLTLHGVVIALLSGGWFGERERPSPRKPRYVEAKLLQLQAPVVQPAPKEDEAAKERARQQREQEARARRERERREAKQRREEQARQAALEKKRREEAARKERERQEQLKKEQAERERREAERRRRQQEELARAMAREEAAAQAAENAERVASYEGYIQDRIEANWSRPPSARLGMEVTLEIQLVPTGRVVGVSVVDSSGNAAFDRSAEQAVHKVGRFDRLQGMDPALFEQYFRTLRLRFRPEDLRL